MAKQTINIGAAANDGTGDPIRTAFGKVNDNFTEIYTANTGVNTGDQNLSAYATTAAVAAGYQPLDSDLTAIAALTTTAYGRALLSTTDAPTLRTAIGLGQTDAPTFLTAALSSQGLANAPSLAIGTGAGFYQPTNTQISFSGNNSEAIRFTGGGIRLGTNELGWGTFAINSVILARDADGILAQRNGTAKQVHRVYNTFLGTTANEWGGFDWLTTSNTLRIGTDHAGTGGARDLQIITNGIARMTIQGNGNASFTNTVGFGGNVNVGYLLGLASLLVSQLPAASGTAIFSLVGVSNATVTAAAGKGTTVVGGGSNKVIVMNDGTNWVIL